MNKKYTYATMPRILKNKLMQDIMTEVFASYEPEELRNFKTFEDFFAQIDVQYAYEEEWNAEYYKPFYSEFWQYLQALKDIPEIIDQETRAQIITNIQDNNDRRAAANHVSKSIIKIMKGQKDN